MNRTYQTPEITIIEIEVENVVSILSGSDKKSYNTTQFKSVDENFTPVSYGGINNDCIGDGGFLNSK